MKKNYITPTVKVVTSKTTPLLNGSNLPIEDTTTTQQMSRGIKNKWDDDDEWED